MPGYKATEAQIHSIPIYCVAFVVTLTIAQLSDRLRQRFVFALFGTLVIMVGLVIEIVHPKSVGVRYAGMFFITAGAYVRPSLSPYFRGP